jgi:hypothetical protein
MHTEIDKHQREAEWFPPENRARRNANTTHWRTWTSRYAELDAMAEEHLPVRGRVLARAGTHRRSASTFKPRRTDETASLDDKVAA